MELRLGLRVAGPVLFLGIRVVAQRYHRIVARSEYICDKGRTGGTVFAGREGAIDEDYDAVL
jgi:hypothetical protein